MDTSGVCLQPPERPRVGAGPKVRPRWDPGRHSARAAASRQSLTDSKSYAPTYEHIFPPRVFTELQNAQAVVLPYDGVNPLPPQFCYLKPHYLDVQTSYFDHLESGAL